jgi:hypothetical protein
MAIKALLSTEIPTHSRAMTAAAFLRSTPASTFYAGSAPMPRSPENR